MNYDNQNKVHDYLYNNIVPHLVHKMQAVSFEEYLRRFSYLPSGLWLRDGEKVKISRIISFFDPIKFVEKYKPYIVTYNAPVKVEDGLQKMIYQMSPTLHLEASLWIWVEHEKAYAYLTVLGCYREEKDYLKLVDELASMRLVGNTEDKPQKPGFGGFGGIEKSC